MVRAAGVQSPFQNVPVNDERARQLTVTLTLLDRADVHDQGADGDLGRQVGWLHPIEALAGGLGSASIAGGRVMIPPG